ncbi:acyl-coenzyme A thioesterase PaaI-like protein [Streptosporangium becharense]|uniref:Acyl-coenzyme A thioesterase PaaI-like protein n=1 Tax=Streptosporangium becharense TaxID=1816182 RepID=A0A7W9MI90_9ACTN|nr:DUF4442 domain-containing protein [Streptosporangium becharense]MBB2915528.1 acyl-coenzyme A thioesterase PaaI-like protein [Streptosporangium becharense]MBB5821278.1 acyl-coenzyme A thioesterase PaaI-like protein [Streptosporangium becharense]
MSFDAGSLMLQSVPFAGTLDISYDKVEPGLAIARMADRVDLHNHMGGPHAGVLFSVAELASGAAMLAAFGDQLSRATPLVANAAIRYTKLALGDIVAEARLVGSREEVVALLDAGKRPEFEIAVEVRTADGTPVSEVTVFWTLRPNR